MPAEVEAKLLAEGPEPLAALATEERLGDAVLGPPQSFDEVDRYLDTADGRLAAAEWACRLRERDGAIRISLKGPLRPSAASWLHERQELEGRATASLDPRRWPPSEARALLDELRSGGRLVERFRLLQRRTDRTVRVGSDPPLGTLTLDEVTIRQGTRDGGSLFVVELELCEEHGEEEARLLTKLAEELAARPGLAADPRSKLEHALERLALS